MADKETNSEALEHIKFDVLASVIAQAIDDLKGGDMPMKTVKHYLQIEAVCKDYKDFLYMIDKLANKQLQMLQ